MKLFCLFGEIPQQMHRGFAIARRVYDRYISTDEVALDRYCRLLRFEQAKADGNSAQDAAQIAVAKSHALSMRDNSNIENFNGTIRREVFNFIPNIEQSIQGIQEVLDDFIATYNTIRPNLALAYRDGNNRLRYATPFEYNQSLLTNPK